MRQWRLAARQRRHHREFRIAAPDTSPAARARLGELAQSLAAALEVPPPAPAPPPFDHGQLAVAATYLWRARRKIHRNEADTSRESRQVARYLRNMQEALDAAGVAVQDHDGTAYQAGLSLEVLAFEADPAATAEVVKETVRPTVYVHGDRVQMGQVIVACPLGEAR